jgi:hypothetical protein
MFVRNLSEEATSATVDALLAHNLHLHVLVFSPLFESVYLRHDALVRILHDQQNTNGIILQTRPRHEHLFSFPRVHTLGSSRNYASNVHGNEPSQVLKTIAQAPVQYNQWPKRCMFSINILKNLVRGNHDDHTI